MTTEAQTVATRLGNIGSAYSQSLFDNVVLTAGLVGPIMTAQQELEENMARYRKSINTDRHNSRKGYDWGFVSPTNRMMFFVRDNGSRGNKVLDNQMKDFTGTYIQTDGYVSYKRVGERLGKDIVQIPCLAHIKRKFHDSIKYNAKKARQALKIINEIFANERQYREQNLKPNQIEASREPEIGESWSDMLPSNIKFA